MPLLAGMPPAKSLMKHFLIRSGILAGLVLTPLAGALALDFGATVVFGGKSYTVGGNFTSTAVSEGSLQVTMNTGENLTVTSPDTTKFTYSDAPPATETCGTTYSIRFEKSSGSAQTFTLTPSSSTCGSSGGGGGGTGTTGSGGGGGGGGGGAPTYASTPAPAPAPAPVPAPALAPAAFLISSDLALGSEGAEVTQLQNYLAADPEIYPDGMITGYFGPKTQAAVKRFQAKHGLPQVGRVGPLTRAKLAEGFGGAATPSPTPAPAPAAGPAIFARSLIVGSSGDDVRALQEFLAKDSALYPEGDVTGYYGALTRAAVQRFQEMHGIAGSGVPGYGTVGPKTRAKLNELMGGAPIFTPPAATPAGTPPADAAKIKELQDQLKALQDQLNALQGQ